jgi:hypothetical protein
MTDLNTKNFSRDVPVFWGPLSLAIPVGAVVISFLFIASASKGVGGDMVGFAFFIYAAIAVGCAAILGIGAAFLAMRKKERFIALAIVGFLMNLVLIAIGVFYGSIFIR